MFADLFILIILIWFIPRNITAITNIFSLFLVWWDNKTLRLHSIDLYLVRLGLVKDTIDQHKEDNVEHAANSYTQQQKTLWLIKGNSTGNIDNRGGQNCSWVIVRAFPIRLYYWLKNKQIAQYMCLFLLLSILLVSVETFWFKPCSMHIQNHWSSNPSSRCETRHPSVGTMLNVGDA